MAHLNAMIPEDLRRRLLIARANTGKTMTQLLVEFIQEGLSKIERPQKPKR